VFQYVASSPTDRSWTEHKNPLDKREQVKREQVGYISYIPTRYPNGFPAGAPMDCYDQPTAEEAVRLAEAILEFVGSQL
jgi:HEPN domain-containing protein